MKTGARTIAELQFFISLRALFNAFFVGAFCLGFFLIIKTLPFELKLFCCCCCFEVAFFPSLTTGDGKDANSKGESEWVSRWSHVLRRFVSGRGLYDSWVSFFRTICLRMKAESRSTFNCLLFQNRNCHWRFDKLVGCLLISFLLLLCVSRNLFTT